MKLKMKNQMRSKTIGELQKELQERAKNLFEKRLERSQRKLKNTSSILHARKDIARIKTLLREKELQA